MMQVKRPAGNRATDLNVSYETKPLLGLFVAESPKMHCSETMVSITGILKHRAHHGNSVYMPLQPAVLANMWSARANALRV